MTEVLKTTVNDCRSHAQFPVFQFNVGIKKDVVMTLKNIESLLYVPGAKTVVDCECVCAGSGPSNLVPRPQVVHCTLFCLCWPGVKWFVKACWNENQQGTKSRRLKTFNGGINKIQLLWWACCVLVIKHEAQGRPKTSGGPKPDLVLGPLLCNVFT